MSMPNVYWGSGAHMSADLKATIQRVRTKRPELFAANVLEQVFQDGNGNQTKVKIAHVRAIAPTGRERHAMGQS